MTAPATDNTLGTVPPGGSAVIVGYTEGCDRRRFLEMGFLPGVRVTVLRTAPLGDPVEYSVMGSRVSIRRRDAAAVLVKRIER